MAQPPQQQTPPGVTGEMTPTPDHGEQSYRGSGRLAGKEAVITGGDSGIGRAVAIAYAREGADVLISYLDEHDDAKETATGSRRPAAGRAVPGDLADPAHCRDDRRPRRRGVRPDRRPGQQRGVPDVPRAIEEIPDEEWDQTFAINLSAFFHLTKAALPHMGPGSSIIGSSSVNSDMPTPDLLPYAATKAGIANMCASWPRLLGDQGIRVNSVAPGPIWTPLIPATMPPEQVESFGEDTPLGRPGQPAELAPVYVLLASDEASYVSGARVAVTGGKPIL